MASNSRKYQDSHTRLTDNEGCMISKEAIKYYSQWGITPRVYPPEVKCPTAEISNKIVSRARIALHTSSIEDKFWWEAIAHQDHAQYRTPQKHTVYRTPHEAWTGIIPDACLIYESSVPLFTPSNCFRHLRQKESWQINRKRRVF